MLVPKMWSPSWPGRARPRLAGRLTGPPAGPSGPVAGGPSPAACPQLHPGEDVRGVDGLVAGRLALRVERRTQPLVRAHGGVRRHGGATATERDAATTGQLLLRH